MRAISRLHDWALLLVLPAMVAELLFPQVRGSASLKVCLVAFSLGAVVGRRIFLPVAFHVQVLLVAWFVFAAILQSAFFFSSFFRADLENAVQVIAVAPFLAAALRSDEERARYLTGVARLLVPLGVLASLVGWAKLYFLTQGVQFASLEWQGLYPRGTSLKIDYNVFSVGLAVCLCAALWLRHSKAVPGVERFLASLAVPLIMLTVAFTSSRRGALFLLLLLAASPLMLPPGVSSRTRKAAILLPAGAVVAAAAVLAALYVGLVPEFLQGLLGLVDLGKAAERLTAVDGAGRLVETRAPLIAYAWESLSRTGSLLDLFVGRGDSYLFEMGRVFNREFGYDYPHNFLLSAVLHGGVLYAGALVVLVVLSSRNLWAVRRAHAWLPAASLVLLLFGVTSASSVYNIDILYFAIFIGLLMPQAEDGRSPSPSIPA